MSTNASNIFLPLAGYTVLDKLLEIFNELNIMQDIEREGVIILRANPKANILEISIFSGDKPLAASAFGKIKIGLEKNTVEFEGKDGKVIEKASLTSNSPWKTFSRKIIRQ